MRKVLLALLVVLVAVSVHAGSAAKAKLKGTIRDGVYTSPDGSFSVKVPAILDRNLTVSDQAGVEGEVVVYFRDDWCRQFYVQETPLASGGPTPDEVLRQASENIARVWETTRRAVIDSRQPIDVGRGPSVAIRLHQSGGPCRALVGDGNKLVEKEVPSDVIAYVFVESQAIYEVGLVVSRRKVGDIALAPSANEGDLKAFLTGLVTRLRDHSR